MNRNELILRIFQMYNVYICLYLKIHEVHVTRVAIFSIFLAILGCFKVLFVLMSCVFLPHISINTYSTVSWYVPIDGEFCTLYIDAVHFFHI